MTQHRTKPNEPSIKVFVFTGLNIFRQRSTLGTPENKPRTPGPRPIIDSNEKARAKNPEPTPKLARAHSQRETKELFSIYTEPVSLRSAVRGHVCN